MEETKTQTVQETTYLVRLPERPLVETNLDLTIAIREEDTILELEQLPELTRQIVSAHETTEITRMGNPLLESAVNFLEDNETLNSFFSNLSFMPLNA
jgi:hypothetical protein